jgi:plastocyanin
MSPRYRLVLAVGAMLLVAGACGSSSSGGPTPSPGSPVTLTISAAGLTPNDVRIALGERVRFINSDTQPHSVGSDPHPDHTDCPEINQVGFLLPGQSRETGNFVQPRTCGFHDHDNPTVTRWQGTIRIQ